ncbi:MAG: hypothetical protein QXZ63_06745 [Sulfolobales archaeon]
MGIIFVYVPKGTKKKDWEYFIVEVEPRFGVPLRGARVTYEEWMTRRREYASKKGVDPERITHEGRMTKCGLVISY